MRKVAKINEKTLGEDTQKILASDSSKSQKIKDLFDLTHDVKEIAEMLNIRYNFAYNVISNYVNMNGLEVEKEEKAGKKQQIIEMFKLGHTNKDIAITLKTNYNYVFNVVKAFKLENPDFVPSKGE